MSTLVTLNKKPEANECMHHWKISLISRIAKLMMPIPMNRARQNIKHEEYGLVKNTGNTHGSTLIFHILFKSI